MSSFYTEYKLTMIGESAMLRGELRNWAIIFGVFMIMGFINQSFFYISPAFFLIGLLWMTILLYKRHSKDLSKIWLLVPLFTIAIYSAWLIMFYIGVYLYPHWEDYFWYRSVFSVAFIIAIITAFPLGIYLALKSIQKRLETPNEEQINSI